METWATFSIIDHRDSVYRQALALFDGIVVPLQEKPIGNQTQEELDQLQAEVEYLQKHKAAEPFAWNSAAFEEWRKPLLAEALAMGYNRDPYADTCFMVSQQLGNVLAVPVYGAPMQYADARKTLPEAELALTVEIMQRLPVPEHDTPLENLVKLRQTPKIRRARWRTCCNGNRAKPPKSRWRKIGKRRSRSRCGSSTG